MTYFQKLKFKTFGKNLNLKLNYIQQKKKVQNCPPAGRTKTPQGFFLYFFLPWGVYYFFYYYYYFLFICPPPSSALSHLLYIFCVFLFILLVGRQSALLGVLNTESSTQASDPTRNKFVCVCVSVPINGKVVAFFFPSIYRYRPGTRTRDAQHICSLHNADALNHSTTRTWRFTYGKIKIVLCVNHVTR